MCHAHVAGLPTPSCVLRKDTSTAAQLTAGSRPGLRPIGPGTPWTSPSPMAAPTPLMAWLGVMAAWAPPIGMARTLRRGQRLPHSACTHSCPSHPLRTCLALQLWPGGQGEGSAASASPWPQGSCVLWGWARVVCEQEGRWSSGARMAAEALCPPAAHTRLASCRGNGAGGIQGCQLPGAKCLGSWTGHCLLGLSVGLGPNQRGAVTPGSLHRVNTLFLPPNYPCST